MTLVTLEPVPDDENVKSIGFYVPTNPAEPDGETSKLYINPFESGDDEVLLRFLKDFNRLLRLKNVGDDDLDQRLQLARILLREKALDTFEEAYEAAEAEDDDDDDDAEEDPLRAFNTALDAVKEEFMTADAGSQIKEDIQSFRKPRDMTVSEFFRRVTQLNDLIELTIDDERPLDDRELIKLFEDACPKSWKLQHKLKANYAERTLKSLKAYYKLLENLDDGQLTRRRGNSPPRTTNSGRGRRTRYRPRRGNRPMGRNNGGNGGGGNGGNRGNGGGGRGNGGGNRPQQQQQQQGGPRRSGRFRSTYCPHCRTNDHDGQDCDLYQAYRAGRNNRQGSGNRSSQSQHESYGTERNRDDRSARRNRDEREEEFHVLDVQSDSSADEHEVYVLTRNLGVRERKPDEEPPTPRSTLLVCFPNNVVRKFQALVDSGASLSLAHHRFSDSWTWQPQAKIKTKTGTFTTNATTKLNIILPQFTMHREVSFTFHRDDSTLEEFDYDFILGRDFLSHIGLVINYTNNTFTWDDLTVPMPTLRGTKAEILSSDDKTFEPYETPGMEQANFVLQNVHDYIPEHIIGEERQKLAEILETHKASFQGGIGRFPGPPYDLVLMNNDAPPVHLKPYPIAHSLLDKTKAEVERMVQFGILSRVFKSRWASPSFPIVKPNGNVRIVTDVRQVNQRIVRHPYPIPKLSDLFHRIDGFTHMSALDLSLGFYHVELSAQSKEICTTIFPWGKYRYERLPMGLSVSPDIFQHKMDELLGDLPFVLIYIDDILIFTKGTVSDHLLHLDVVLGRMAEASLQISLPKSHFFAKEAKYLGFILSSEGIRPDPKKIKAVEALAVPKTRKQLRSFIGFCSFIRETINRYSELTAPLTSLLSPKKKFEWKQEHTAAFHAVKQAVIRATMLSFPNYSLPFEIFTDASTYQIGSIIAQHTEDGFKVLAFFAMKMTPAQMKYTVTEQELLAIVMTLRKYRSMIFGYLINIYTDHKNLTFSAFQSARTIRWRLFVEEFGPKFKYIRGPLNKAADALSRLQLVDSGAVEPVDMTEVYAQSTDDIVCPIAYDLLATEQESSFPARIRQRWSKEKFGDYQLYVTNEHQIRVPKSLIRPIMEWYHDMLRHPGVSRMQATLQPNFYWPGMHGDIQHFVSHCDICQKFKRRHREYGELPLAEPVVEPWSVVAIDTIGPWTIPTSWTTRRSRKKSGNPKEQPLQLWCLTIMDLANRWIEIVQLDERPTALVAAKRFDQEWLSRYPRPLRCIHDPGTEFTGVEFQELLDSYGIEASQTTVKNPTANAIIERVHQTMATMLRTSELQSVDFTDPEALKDLINSVAFALRATHHSSLGASPAQLTFQRDMFFPTTYVANRNQQRRMQERRMVQGHAQTNKSRIAHVYQVGDLVLIRRDVGGEVLGKLARPSHGPFEIVHVYANGTVRINHGRYTQRINIRRLLPYRKIN